jgi:hypothetical protein
VATADTFGAQQGHGDKVVTWLNEEIAKSKKKGEAQLYGHVIETSRFGKFEMISCDGDFSIIRELIVRASKRYKIKTLEGAYKPKSFFSLPLGSKDYAKVYYNGNLIGYVELSRGRLLGGKWAVTDEKPR